MKSANMISRLARKLAVSVVVLASTLCAIGETYRVTPEAPGDGNGQAWADDGEGNAPMTLAEAVAVVTSGDTVLLKTGTYKPTATLSLKGFTLRGGLAGTDDTTCSSADSVSVLDGQDTLERIVNVTDSPVVCERIEFARAKKQAFYSEGNNRDIKLYSCRFVGNGLTADYGNDYGDANGGRALYVKSVRPDMNVTSLMCSNCVFAGNAARDTSHYIGLAAVSLFELGHADFYDCQFVTNGVAWSYPLGQSNLETVKGGALLAYDSLVSFTRCSFVGNRSLAKENYGAGQYPAGVVALWYSYNTAFKWTCGITNCLFVGNEGTVSKNAANVLQGSNGGALNIYCADCAGGTACAEIVGCTFAYNLFNTTASSAGLNLSAGNAKIRNCIFYGNRLQSADGAGADLRLSGSSGNVDVDYSLFTADATTSLSASGAMTLKKGYNLVYGDPKFVTTLADFDALVKSVAVGSMSTIAFDPEKLDEVMAMNVHVTDALSPAIDTGDETSPYENEPEPNGSRVNLGAYGNTPEAHVSPTAVQPEIVAGSLAVTFPYETTQPNVAFKLGGPDGAQYKATASILWSTNGTDWAVAKVIGSLGNGAEVDELMGFCVATGSPLQIKVSVSCAGAETREGVKAFDSVDYPCPPSWGKGGGAEVLHVRAGATGDGSGSDWFNARTEFPATGGEIPSTAKEIWVATDVSLGAAVVLKDDVALCGGFGGFECSRAERQPDVLTRMDASDRDYGVQISQNFQHLVFDGFEIVGARLKGFSSVNQIVNNLEILNCRFVGNGTEQTATGWTDGGRAIWISTLTPAYGFRLTCSNCVFAGNVAAADKGQYMGMAAVYLSGVRQANLTDCLFVTNGVAWSQPVGKRPATDLTTASGGAALMANDTSVAMTRCAFVGNRVLASPGYASAGYPCPIVMIKNTIGAAYKAQFTWTCGITNCLFVGNEGTMAAANTSGCDTGALAIYDVQNVSTAEVANCTFAYNIFNTQAGSAALSLTGGKLKIRNSIFYGNRLMDADQIRGADLRIRNQADAKADVDWSLFTSSGEESLYAEAVGALNKGDNLQYGDPKFMTTLADFNALVKTLKVDALDTLAFEPDDETLKAVLALDVHVADALSPAIDTGDDSPYENEPEPNGSRINLGAYGNTSEAHVSPEAVQPEIVAGSLAVTFPYETTQPKVAFKLGGPDGAQYLATATVLWSTNGTDWAVAKVIGSLGNGAEVDELMGFCVATGSPLQIKVSVSCTGAETREGVKAFDSVDYPCPPSWGKGGGAEVLHVRAGATGDGSGNDWFNARTEFPATDADIPSTAKEIWVATDVRLGASVFLKNDVALCGGFGGFECSRAERQLDVLTRMDASDRDYGVQISQNFKHLVFDGFEIVGAKLKGFYSSGVTVNNLEILNCRFVGNGTEQTASVYSDGGRALHVYGASPTYGYRLTCSNCVFAGNVAAADKGPYMGDVAVRLTAIQHANLTDCLFVTNGVAWSQPIGKRSDLTTANAGAALMVNNSSVAMTRCAFVGNRVLASPGYASAGYPCPIVMIKNTIGASPTYTWTCGITNCLFVGNEGTMAVANTSGCDTGALAIYDGTSASTAEVVNCTFAYNLFNTRSGSAALSLTGGKLKIWNSIFYGNRLMDADQIRGADLRIRNQADAKAVVDWSLFTSSGEESLYAEDAAALEVREHVKWGNPKFLTRLSAFDALVKTVKVDALDTLAFEPDDETLKAVLALDVHIDGGSPALDAGDPTSDYSHERRPNGGRINLGAYGNTSEARQTTFGLMLIVR